MTDWKPGARIEHPTFGAGTILQCDDQYTTVHFDDCGRRKFASHHVVLSSSTLQYGQGRRPQREAAPPPSEPTGSTASNTPGVPATVDRLLDGARRQIDSEDSLTAFVSAMRKALPGPTHPHVGVLSGMRVHQFQNWLLDGNSGWQLTDGQILAVIRVEFPLASGQAHVGDVDAGLAYMAGIRAHYNRDGLQGPSPVSRGLPVSKSYGTF